MVDDDLTNRLDLIVLQVTNLKLFGIVKAERERFGSANVWTFYKAGQSERVGSLAQAGSVLQFQSVVQDPFPPTLTDHPISHLMDFIVGQLDELAERVKLASPRKKTFDQAILDAYERAGKDGSLRVTWDELRDKMQAQMTKEPPSKPTLREVVYSMWEDPEVVIEIEKRGLADLVHRPPGQQKSEISEN